MATQGPSPRAAAPGSAAGVREPVTEDAARLLRTRLGAFATGICVVLADQEEPVPLGVTVNSFSSVSLDPPLLSWCLKGASPRRPGIEKAGLYSINVLARGQDETALAFAGRPDPMADPSALGVSRGDDGVWAVDGALATFVVRPWQAIEAGDHVVYLVELLRHRGRTGDPLIFFDGAFRAMPSEAGTRGAAARRLERMLLSEWY